MPTYQYQGTNQAGKTVRGTAESTSPQQLYLAMKQQGIYIHKSMVVRSRYSTLYRLKSNELSDFSRQVGTMQATGIPLVKALELLLNQDLKPRLREVYQKVYAGISQGNPLSDAMEQCGKSFPILMINMYRSGEASGRLDETAMKMSKYYAGEHKLNLKIRNAMAYPSILAIMTLLITLGMFTLILPNFFVMFEDSGASLNLLTRIVIGISQYLVQRWYVIVVWVASLLIFCVYCSTLPTVNLQVDTLKLQLPQVGRLLRTIYTARFARTLSSLYSSGISMLDAVEVSVRTIGNRYVERQFPHVLNRIRGGESLSSALDGVDGLEKKLISAIYIGEESGRLDEMLLGISDEYDFEADMAIERMLTYVEPVMIVIMALVVGTVMLAVMIPVMNMKNTIS